MTTIIFKLLISVLFSLSILFVTGYAQTSQNVGVFNSQKAFEESIEAKKVISQLQTKEQEIQKGTHFEGLTTKLIALS